MIRRTIIVTAPRGSGGSYAHLSRVLPLLMDEMRDWQFELHASREVLKACFDRDDESWMKPLVPGYLGRILWETVHLPRRLRADAAVRIWSPFGPPLNPLLASRTAWMSRNIIPLVPTRDWEVSPSDHARLRAMREISRTWARHALLTVSVSEYARDRLAALAGVDPRRVAVIPHGTDPPVVDVRCSTKELEQVRAGKYVFHVGQPVPYRRTREVIGAHAQLTARRPETPPLVLAGQARGVDRAYERACLEQIEPLVRQGRALVLGQVKHTDALALMSSAHAFVYPSVHENCPNVVLEALAAGRVGIYADIPPVRELADDAALYVREPTPSSLAAVLESALFDESLRVRLSERASRRARSFTWAATAARTAQALTAAFGK